MTPKKTTKKIINKLNKTNHLALTSSRDALTQTLHQELQKVREGLKARIELLLEKNTARDNMDFLDFSHGYRSALLDVESYLSELDQPNR